MDVILSPAAKQLFGSLAIECKNQESLNVTQTFNAHAKKYDGQIPLLVHKRNHMTPLVTMRLIDFLPYVIGSIVGRCKNAETS